jgi:hypothetical protein
MVIADNMMPTIAALILNVRSTVCPAIQMASVENTVLIFVEDGL